LLVAEGPTCQANSSLKAHFLSLRSSGKADGSRIFPVHFFLFLDFSIRGFRRAVRISRLASGEKKAYELLPFELAPSA